MATIRKSLARKKQKDSCKQEVMFRLSLSRENVFRIKSQIYCEAKYWDAKKEKVLIPRVHGKVQAELLSLQKKLDELSSCLLEQILNLPAEKVNKELLEHIVHVFHFGEDENKDDECEDDFVDWFKTFISVRVKTSPRDREFLCVLRMLQRYELYRGKGYKLT